MRPSLKAASVPALALLTGVVPVRLVDRAGPALHAQAPAEHVRTVWSGVYTDTQAARASSTFSQVCSTCHTLGPDGNGALAGEKFWQGFAQKTVGDLMAYVSTNMPNGNGGSLPRSTYLDLVALILKANGFPAGSTELTEEASGQIKIVPVDGSAELPANTLARVVGCLTRSGSDWVLQNATAPERVDRPGAGPDDARRPLGNRTMALKFVVTRLDALLGQRVSVSGLLLGAGGADGMNVTHVVRVAEACP